MKRLSLIVGLLVLTVQLFAQTNNIIGTWWSPRGLAGVSFKFDSSGVVKYHSFTCMSQFNRTGHYAVSKDSIFINYDSLTAEQKINYQIKPKLPSGDTLFIMDRHKIKVNDYVSIYDKIIGKTFTLTDSVFIPELYLRSYQVLFNLDKFTIRTESYLFLDSLAGFLSYHKTLTIKIEQHGDEDPEHSTRLSEKRAEAIRDYLITKGINPNRLTANGYGDTKPIWADFEIKHAKTKKEKEKRRQLNRRTEFLILRTDFAELR